MNTAGLGLIVSGWLVVGVGCKNPEAPLAAPVPASAATVLAHESNASEDAVTEHEPGDEGDEVAIAPVRALDPAAPSAGNSGALLREASRELGLMQSSTYSHHTHVDEAAHRFEYDCSGLADYALARIAPTALAELTSATVRRPLAKHFVAFAQALPPPGRASWKALSHVTELLPGDLIAWLRPADVKTHNTGHVMIVRQPPVASIVASGMFDMAITDSTSVPHGSGDSRAALHATGLGEGTIVLVVDAQGTPVGYRWSREKRARVHTTSVALLRLQ